MKTNIWNCVQFLYAIVFNTVLFCLIVPLTILGLITVPIGLLFADDSQKDATMKTDGVNVWWLQRLPRWLYWWDNEYDGFLGDEYYRWAGRDIPFGWKNTDFVARWWWGSIRNSLHNFKSFLIACDIRQCVYTKVWGQDFVRDRVDATGFQFLKAKRANGFCYYRIYWVYRWPGTNSGMIVEIGHEFRGDHWAEDYTGIEYKNYKGFSFLIHPFKGLGGV